ncbi:MAG: NAD-dependent malic enzyme [Deltaproteobacteria bacterium]|jgi:malate dehydrogenase (oxaloacetate-decarboxylating)|nr:NAD-dependent malic enzyme [Deltaproteobacteria bacterium]
MTGSLSLTQAVYDGEIDLAYAKSSAKLCRALADDPAESPRLTSRWNRVAVVTDGSGVPGAGDVGPLPALPYVEKKSAIFRKLAGIEAFPLAIDSRNIEETVRVVTALSPSFGAVNIEAVSEPRCLDIKNRLASECELPVFQDASDGIPVVCLAALLNSLKLVGKSIDNVRIVLSGTEADGMPVSEFLSAAGAGDIIVCDRSGAIHKRRPGPTNWVKERLAKNTNPRQIKGSPAKALSGADVFISLSGPPVLTRELLSTMARNAILFYLTDCTPDLFARPETDSGTPVIATTCPVLPNQLTACLVFPGLLRGALDARASAINLEMKVAAATSLADMVPASQLDYELVIPSVLAPGLIPSMAKAVSEAAAASGVASPPPATFAVG